MKERTLLLKGLNRSIQLVDLRLQCIDLLDEVGNRRGRRRRSLDTPGQSAADR